MRVISLGWGVQSWTLAAMVALGELPSVAAAIHADTTYEKSWTYRFAELVTPWLEERGVKVVTVQNPYRIFVGKGVQIPAFTWNGKTKGQLRRQCTDRWKLVPIKRWLQANRDRSPVEMLIGISLDEATRMRPSAVKYISNEYPLVNLGITRDDCLRWLRAHDLPIPGKSACVFCPYQNLDAWRDLRQADSSDWLEAVEVDQRIRKARPPFDLFVHPARRPLEEINFSKPGRQFSLWDEECYGLCGV